MFTIIEITLTHHLKYTTVLLDLMCFAAVLGALR